MPDECGFSRPGKPSTRIPHTRERPTVPCQIIEGAQTTLGTANQVSVSVNGFLHVSQFLTNGTVAIFSPSSHGNVAPSRVESTFTNDLLGVATDSHVTDFVLSRRGNPPFIVVLLPGTTVPAHNFSASDFAQAGGLAIDTDQNLVVGGYTYDGLGLIETLGTSASLSAPSVVRKLAGPLTGLLPGSLSNFGSNSISLAVDPVSGELYVYNTDLNGKQQISVFGPRSSGNIAPVRVIAGALTQVGAPGLLNNKIAVSNDGRLFVAEANNRVLVFAPGADGNVAPAQVIQDSTLGGAAVGQGGIGVRSCRCQ